MASLVDVDNTPGNTDQLVADLTEAVKVVEVSSDVKNEDVKPEGTVTDPFADSKFSTVDEALAGYKNLESAYGRMANDLGSQRKLTDRLLDLKRDDDLLRNEPAAPAVTPMATADFLDNPTQALDRYSDAREARTRLEYDDKLQKMESQMQSDRFMTKHPDFLTTGQTDEFRTWATGTPIRARVANAAAQGDWDAADILLTEYKTLQAAPTGDPVADAALEAAKAAGLESAAQGGSSEVTSGKIYKRTDLIELKIRKPAVYQDPAFQAEILKAYSEGRVK